VELSRGRSAQHERTFRRSATDGAAHTVDEEAPAMTTPRAQQYTEGQGREPEHTHPPVVHTHDHYHVSHHHRSGVGAVAGEWEHRTYWHTHEHNHAPLTHSHDYGQQDEEAEHAKEAHIHDHLAPATSPA